MKSIPIPVIMFHTVRPKTLPWFWSFLSCPPGLFESYLKYLKWHGYETPPLLDIVAHIDGTKSLPERSIMLTFDDGYLDNWTIAAPLLKKYGFTGTVFVNPEFVDPRGLVRRQVTPGDWSSVTRDLVDGFMSWEELRNAQSSGVLDVQSHGMSHTWYPVSNKIIDFHHPGDRYPWLAWNAHPERKHLWLAEDQSDLVDYGTPVYAHEKSFIARRYFEPVELQQRLVILVQENGKKVFFERPDWRDILSTEAAKIDATGRYESEEEYKERIIWELRTSKEEISRQLSKPVEIICWPGGGHNEVTCEAARQVGYKGWTVHKIPNIPGRGTPDIGRISVPVLNAGCASSILNKLIFVYQVEGYRNSVGWRQAKWLIRRLRRVVTVANRK
jgi:peptidoglycan/xylan/chitin deacetylase (PgdA/CDA1 family)